MTDSTKLLSAEDRDRVARLQWYARQVVEGLTVGSHRSPHKGFSVEFKEHRQYVRGDEIRSIDWKLFGKTDRLYIRQYEEETNLRATLVVDQSGSMKYKGHQGDGVSKHDFAVRLAACLAYLFVGQHDAVGLATFDTTVQSYIPPRNRPSHLSGLLTMLATSECGGETRLSDVINLLAPKIRRRGVVILISDCFDDAESLLRSLSFLQHAHNDVVIFQVWHPDELTFPFYSRTQFRSLEKASDQKVIDPHQIRKAYLSNLEKYRQALSDGCKQRRISLIPCSTDQSHSSLLASFISQRGIG
jgi:uncharacterized protein (DUF58 family)